MLTFEGGARQRIEAMLRPGEEVVADWSMSDEPPYATACCRLLQQKRGGRRVPAPMQLPPHPGVLS